MKYKFLGLALLLLSIMALLAVREISVFVFLFFVGLMVFFSDMEKYEI